MMHQSSSLGRQRSMRIGIESVSPKFSVTRGWQIARARSAAPPLTLIPSGGGEVPAPCLFRYRGSFGTRKTCHSPGCGTRPPWSTRTPKHIPNNVAPNGRVDLVLNGDLTRVAVLFWAIRPGTWRIPRPARHIPRRPAGPRSCAGRASRPMAASRWSRSRRKA